MSDPDTVKRDSVEEKTEAREESQGPPAVTPKQPAVKDKQCQYCHQHFTSSSLGRHLDQFLFKKKPDGIHDVEEIRRLRSTITRRTPRNAPTANLNKAASPASSAAPNSNNITTSYPATLPPNQLNSTSGKPGFGVRLNQPSWLATGVINDIPNSTQTSQLRIPSNSYEVGRVNNASNPETVRALELALQEVLDSVKAATSRTQAQPSPFDFDIRTQTFPALCLYALPPPPSLFSTHPFPSPSSVPLNPPSVEQRDTILQSLQAKIHQWKSDRFAAAAAGRQRRSSVEESLQAYTDEMETIERSAREQEDLVIRHVDMALNYWMSYPPETRRDIWQLELMRAFAKESEKRKKVEEQLARTQQEANYLRGQVEKLASCQWPREFAIFPPDMLPLPPAVARELESKESKFNAAESPRWDYDKLVAKWKRVVMHDKSMGRPGVGLFSDVSRDSVAASSTRHALSSNKGVSQYNNNTNSRTLPALRPQSPPRRLNPTTPDIPSLQQRQLSTSGNNNMINSASNEASAQGEVGGIGDDPLRPSKRARTSLENQGTTSSSGPDGISESSGQQQHLQPQRLPSISTASTPRSGSSPFQSSGCPYPYPSSTEPFQSPYPATSSTADAHGQHPSNNNDTSGIGNGCGAYGECPSSPSSGMNHQNSINGGCDANRIPSLHSMPGMSEHLASNPCNAMNSTSHHSGPETMMSMYPRGSGSGP
ncbi:hypothetical protein VTO42DRAFT_279 [Malbranchea cinnamomea]